MTQNLGRSGQRTAWRLEPDLASG